MSYKGILTISILSLILLLILLFICKYNNTQSKMKSFTILYRAFDNNKINQEKYWLLEGADGRFVAEINGDIEQVYNDQGILFKSLDSYMHSAFYLWIPYNCDSILKLKGFDPDSKFNLIISSDKNNIIETSIIKFEKTNYILLNGKFPKRSPKDDTCLILQTYCLGTKKIKKYIDDYRKASIEADYEIYLHILIENSSKDFWRKKENIKLPFDHNLPRTNIELQKYLNWIQKIYAQPVLTDAWGRKILFSIENGQLIARSAGKDGVWNSKDEIRFTKSILDDK